MYRIIERSESLSMSGRFELRLSPNYFGKPRARQVIWCRGDSESDLDALGASLVGEKVALVDGNILRVESYVVLLSR